MAVSLDYAIFLLHSFSAFRKEHPPEAAMALL
jgi:predicted RND superfamily exporter protein